jgi:hypothetical protein
MSSRPSPVTHPRGRLPARVYWMRRGLVALTALVLVFGFAKVFGSIGGGSSDKGAQLAANESTKAPPSTSASANASTETDPSPTASTSSTAPTLAAPSGPCNPEDLSVTPVVSVAHAVNPVTIALKITGSSPACNFAVSPKAVAVKIVSGSDRIWSSQDCPRSVPRQTVVVRSGAETTVPVTWTGRRSNGTCANTNKWALPGYYHVLAAVIGSTPTDTQFQLTVAPRAVITKTAKPKPHQKPTASSTPSKSASSTPSKGTGAKGKGSSCGGDNAAGTC